VIRAGRGRPVLFDEIKVLLDGLPPLHSQVLELRLHGYLKGDYVELKGIGESGRIVRPGSNPGFWIVRFDAGGEEKEVAEDLLTPIY